MNRLSSYRGWVGLGVVLSVLWAMTSCSSPDRTEGGRSGDELERPNIIFIMADDLGYADLSSYGRENYETPNLDALAADGMLFTQAYAIAPVCSPTRVGLMTGQYPARHAAGLWEPFIGRHRRGLASTPSILAASLKRNGYSTALIGKWHLGWLPEFQPSAHGFDFAFGPLSGGADYVSHLFNGTPGLYLNGENIDRDGYLTDVFTDEAIRFIRAAEQPYFLSVQYTAPHSPWQGRGDDPYPPERPRRDGGSPETYAEMVLALDEGIGRILQTLEELGQGEQTLVIFTSDNGGAKWSDMGPLRGRKGQLWEVGIRVPAFARWPGVIEGDVSTNQVVTTLDWSATMLAAAGLELPADLDGVDVLPLLKGQAPEENRTVFGARTSLEDTRLSGQVPGSIYRSSRFIAVTRTLPESICSICSKILVSRMT